LSLFRMSISGFLLCRRNLTICGMLIRSRFSQTEIPRLFTARVRYECGPIICKGLLLVNRKNLSVSRFLPL